MHRNPFALAALAASAVPGLVPARTTALPAVVEGLERAGVIAEDGRRAIVTAPTTAAAGASLERELHVSDALLGTSLRALLPPVLGTVRLPEGGRAVVTDAPVGAPLAADAVAASAQLARSLGQAVARIHAVPRYAAEAAGVETFTAATLRHGHRERFERAEAENLLPSAVAQRWRHLLADDDLWDFSPQFVHGDLSDEVLFMDGDRVTGVIGWSQASVGDPAEDLAWLIASLDPETFDDLYESYRREIPTLPHRRLVERAQALGEFALLRWMLHGLDIGDEEIIADGREMLSDLDEDLIRLARSEAERAYDELTDADDPVVDGQPSHARTSTHVPQDYTNPDAQDDSGASDELDVADAPDVTAPPNR